MGVFWLDITIFYDFFSNKRNVFSLFFFYGFFFSNYQFVYLLIHKMDHLGLFTLPELKLGINQK